MHMARRVNIGGDYADMTRYGIAGGGYVYDNTARRVIIAGEV